VAEIAVAYWLDGQALLVMVVPPLPVAATAMFAVGPATVQAMPAPVQLMPLTYPSVVPPCLTCRPGDWESARETRSDVNKLGLPLQPALEGQDEDEHNREEADDPGHGG
jgi:hypothetical protein